MKSFTLSEWRSLKDPLSVGPHNLEPYGNYYTRNVPIKFITLHITVGGSDDDAGAAGTTRYGMNASTPAAWAVCTGNSRIYTGLPLGKAGWTQGVSGRDSAGGSYNFNRRGWGIEISKRNTSWGVNVSNEDKLLRMAAAACAPVVIKYGLPIRLVRNRDQISRMANAGQAVGFTYHADLDPSRRSDPGLVRGKDTFPIQKFLRMVQEEVNLRKGGSTPAPAPAPAPTPAPSLTIKAGTVLSVTATALNARSGAGTNYSTEGSVPQGTRLTATGKVSGAWCEAKTPWQMKNGGSSWFHTSYLKVVSQPAAPAPTTVKYKVTATALNARSGAGTTYKITGTVPKGTVITATGKTSGDWVEGKTPWMLKNGGSAWFHKGYLARV